MQKIFEFEELHGSDLIVDALYKGGKNGNTKDDPLSKILGCGNMGGIRIRGTINKPYLVLLYSSLTDLDWPDSIDIQTGIFTYFGDNKSPGVPLHKSKKKGNIILNSAFKALHDNIRENIPPFFVFTKNSQGRDVIFRGLAVPGAKNYTSYEDLIAVWKVREGRRFQNYKAIFTILDVAEISRAWIEDIKNGDILTKNAPEIYSDWVRNQTYKPLIAERAVEYRTRAEQLPTENDMKLIKAIHGYFEDGFAFEQCAAEIIKLMDKNIISCDLTRPWVDGGRDAIGKYRIGMADNCVVVDFAMEAKRYDLDNPVTVKHTSRLISRLRFRQFGVLITTSYVHQQAYREIKDDGHPVVIVCAKDIVDILKNNGYTSESLVLNWLKNNFARTKNGS